MKCVRVVGQGIPHRLTNDDARKLVEVDKDGEYCPKHVFKKFWADNPDTRMRDSVYAQLERDRKRASDAARTPKQHRKRAA